MDDNTPMLVGVGEACERIATA